MLSNLPRWLELGAFTLSLLAGVVNAVGLLGFEHQSVSHLSGIATQMGVAISSLDVSWLHLFGIALSFMLGAAISGAVISSATLKLGRHYDTLLFIEGGLLLAAMFMLRDHVIFGHYLASAACGLQNAMATTYSGAIIRTTHVTGVVTDLGILVGAALRGESFDRRKALLFVLIISGFVSGGVLGAVLFGTFEFTALLFPAAFCFVLALSYKRFIYSKRRA